MVEQYIRKIKGRVRAIANKIPFINFHQGKMHRWCTMWCFG